MTEARPIEDLVAAYESQGSYRGAATLLGMSRSNVTDRLRKHFDANPEGVLHRNCTPASISTEDVAYYWYKTDEASIFVDRRSKALSYEEIRDGLIEEMKAYAPTYQPISYSQTRTNLLVVDPADVHIGKLSRTLETGHEYDSSIAVSRVETGIKDIIAKAANHGIAEIIFVIGNDILHTDNSKRTTTGGTAQDTDGQWWENFLAAKMCYIKAIELLTQLARVRVIFCPSNHDFTSGFFLADNIASWFASNPNVTFGEYNKSISINHRKYVEFGLNLIGFTHGDGAKEKDLPSLMQYEARESWGRTKFATFYTHHMHHKQRNFNGPEGQKLEKDHIGVTVINSSKGYTPDNGVYVEIIRSPSPPDAWHAKNGYVNMQAIEAFVHDPETGPIARLTTYF